MKEVQFGEDIYLNEYTEYDKSALHELFGELYAKLDEAEASGLSKVYLTFRSSLDPYEDNCTGPVEVQVRGRRELTQTEVTQEKEVERLKDLARKLAVTYYEASVADRLEKANKIGIK